MTHTRYWAATLATALCGGFIVIVRFAFSISSTPWIVFGVAIAATVCSLAAFAVALLRSSQAFSGLSAINALIGAWTIIAMLTLNKPAAGWLAFACGLGLLMVALRALALHETTIERIVYGLEGTGADDEQLGTTTNSRVVRRLTVSAPMRSWLSWLTNTAIAVAGGFIVILTFALTRPGTSHASPRWLAFGLAIGVACVAVGSLLDRALLHTTGRTADWTAEGRRALLALAGGNLATAVALIVTMIVSNGDTARWIAFGLGCAMVGISLVALTVHEVTTERVRHELEVAQPAPIYPSAPSIGAPGPA
ncbi:MAG TPA: hypothetical protein VMB51_04510 [Solirubrobacteraceae bacterium]|nr:hypothetical protein [Solirubrobacteraceae bacterium]